MKSVGRQSGDGLDDRRGESWMVRRRVIPRLMPRTNARRDMPERDRFLPGKRVGSRSGVGVGRRGGQELPFGELGEDESDIVARDSRTSRERSPRTRKFSEVLY